MADVDTIDVDPKHLPSWDLLSFSFIVLLYLPYQQDQILKSIEEGTPFSFPVCVEKCLWTLQAETTAGTSHHNKWGKSHLTSPHYIPICINYINQSINQLIYISIYVSIHPSIHLSIYLSSYRSVVALQEAQLHLALF